MRHQLKRHRIGRGRSHRKATLAALSSALIEHKHIRTTLSKAKALRVYVEPMITRAKVDTTHNRREVFRHLQNKHAIKELFGDISTRVGDRAGGYTRIVKLGPRPGDGAEMALIELVDYNEAQPERETAGSRRTRRGGGRSRRGKKTEQPVAATTPEAPEVDEVAAEAPEADASDAATVEAPEVEEAQVEDAQEEAQAEAEVAEEEAVEEKPADAPKNEDSTDDAGEAADEGEEEKS